MSLFFASRFMTTNRTFLANRNLFSTHVDISKFANQKDVTKIRVQEAIVKYQRHKSDTGSPAAQIASSTEKIMSLTKHFAVHKKDKASWRGYQALLTHRRRMLEYLKRKDVDEYNKVVSALGLSKGKAK